MRPGARSRTSVTDALSYGSAHTPYAAAVEFPHRRGGSVGRVAVVAQCSGLEVRRVGGGDSRPSLLRRCVGAAAAALRVAPPALGPVVRRRAGRRAARRRVGVFGAAASGTLCRQPAGVRLNTTSKRRLGGTSAGPGTAGPPPGNQPSESASHRAVQPLRCYQSPDAARPPVIMRAAGSSGTGSADRPIR